MKRLSKILKMSGAFFVVLILCHCTYSVHNVSFSEFEPHVPVSKGKPIESKSSQFVVLWFADNTDYVNQAYKQLAQNCPSGTVTGISTQFYTAHGFFSWTNHVKMQGLCL